LVTGGAGTGKTRLVVTWARRAAKRGERTLVACFNRPIAEALRNDLQGTGAMVGTFHDLAVRLLEPHGFRVGENPTAEYWRDALTTAMEFHATAIGTPFDTVVVDEAQDFHPHWLAALQALLDPSGPHRMLLAADPAQALYVKDWSPPAGFVVAGLQYNLRNCGGVAKLVQRLGGPKPLPGAPLGERVTHGYAGGQKEVRKRVRDALRRLLDDHNVPMSQIAVLTTRTDVRDMLRAEPPEGVPLCSWEDRAEDAVLCETVHRAKGLERTAVVLVDMTGQPDPVVLYVGASRAVASLTVVGPNPVAEFLGIRS
jgi:superfamily I DNA/RNA helicase